MSYLLQNFLMYIIEEVVLSYTKSLMPNSPLGPDVVHFAIEKSWPFLPHIAKLGSSSKGRTNANAWCSPMAYNAP